MRRPLLHSAALLTLLLAACTTPAEEDDLATGCEASPATAGCPEADDSNDDDDDDDGDDRGLFNNGSINNAPDDEPPSGDVPRNNDPNEEPDDLPPTSVPEGPYRFMLVEDLSNDDLNGPAPGADIDAIGIELQDGTQVWAESIEDFDFGGVNNEHVDPFELLGFPDSAACEGEDATLAGFTSLGGREFGSYVMVGFGGVTFGAGDALIVWELGPTNCFALPNDWRDDETRLSVSTSTDRLTFIQIGTIGNGSNAIFIP